MTTKYKELEELAERATGGGKQAGDWYTVESPWLPANCEPYIIAGNPDPHAGLYVCDFVTTDIAGVESDWTEDEWSSRNWALAEYIAAANPQVIKSLIADLREKDAALAVLTDALDAIEASCNEEIQKRFGGHSHESADDLGANSHIYHLLVVPRNIARGAVATVKPIRPKQEPKP